MSTNNDREARGTLNQASRDESEDTFGLYLVGEVWESDAAKRKRDKQYSRSLEKLEDLARASAPPPA